MTGRASDPREHLRPAPGDDVGELLRLVDSEPAMAQTLSAERMRRHKTAARAHWQRTVQARSRRRRLFLGLAAAAILALAFGLAFESRRPPSLGTDSTVASASPSASSPSASGRTAERLPASPAPDGPIARVAMVVGSLHDRRDETAQPEALGEQATVAMGAILETDAESRAAFELASGHELRLDVDTRLRLLSGGVLALERGAVYVDSHRSPTSLEIRTPLGIARDVGTRFEVRLDDHSLRVRVRDGLVEVARDGETHEAGVGAELALDVEGAVERRTVPLHGAEWQWSLSVAPSFAGRTLSELLDWVTHETAWQLRIDPEIARGAASVILRGSIEGLLPSDALSVMLPTTGLQHRLVDGVLIVEPLDTTQSRRGSAG